jgi:hypothetical protein
MIGIDEKRNPSDSRDGLLQQLKSLRGEFEVRPVQACEVPTRPRQTGDEPQVDYVIGRKYDGDRPRGRLRREGRGRGEGDDHIHLEADQFGGVGLEVGALAELEGDVLALDPSPLAESFEDVFRWAGYGLGGSE